MENVQILHSVNGFYISIDGEAIHKDDASKFYFDNLKDALVCLSEYIEFIEGLQAEANKRGIRVRGGLRVSTGDIIGTPYIYPQEVTAN